jgi:hypothetical protein
VRKRETARCCHYLSSSPPSKKQRATLDRLQEATIEKDGKRITTRTAVAGQVGSVFQAAGIALPPNLHERAA